MNLQYPLNILIIIHVLVIFYPKYESLKKDVIINFVNVTASIPWSRIRLGDDVTGASVN